MADWNIEKIRDFVNINGDGDKLISTQYKNAHEKLIFLCHFCNTEFDMVWSSYRRGHRHSACSWKQRGENQKYKFDDVKKYIESFGYILLSERYENCDKKLEMICPENHNIEMTYYSFLSGHRCYKCFHIRLENNQRFNIDYVKKYIEDNGRGDMLISQEYQNSYTELIIKCFSCKQNYSSSMSKFSCGYRCPKCAPARWRKTQLENQYGQGNNLAEKRPDLLLSWDWEKNTENPYKIGQSSKKKVFWVCEKCNRSYLATVNSRSAKAQTGCPFCNESKMEKKITKFLLKNKEEFIPQKRFSDCRNKRSLPFDFYLPKRNMVIEANGIHHYEQIQAFGGEDGFMIRKKNDAIKKKYCEDNDVFLIIIPYWEFDNIENILTKELNLQRKEVELIG